MDNHIDLYLVTELNALALFTRHDSAAKNGSETFASVTIKLKGDV